jgi:hypothetical protein
MDCQPMDDLCKIEKEYRERVAIARLEQQARENLFPLGIVNGREYTYAELGGRSYIIITSPARDRKAGRSEVPSGVPVDCMDSPGGVLNTKVGDENGEKR